MRKNITVGLAPDEYMRLNGAAAICNMPLATYVKWLLRGAAMHDPMAQNQMIESMGALMRRLDGIGAALARLPRCAYETASAAPSTTAPAVSSIAASADPPAFASRELIEKGLKARGVPTSTIRQLFAVLEELAVVRPTDSDACTKKAG